MIYGVQFHPEVVHTERGQEVLKAFLYEAAGCRPTWTNVSIIEHAVAEIRAQVGDERVICGLSGGVDSAVAAALVHKAIGDQLTCVFVDTGLLRRNEAEQVEHTFRQQFAIDLVHVKAADRFLDALDDIVDPERKRKTIGELFIRVFEEAARDLGDARFFVQGTLYPDIVESGGGDNANIKSHHNVGGLPDDMDFELVEPLRNLFKDEVRAVGEELGLPEEIVWRQPFPGPGLAVRIIGTITRERVEILQQADAIVVEEIKRAGLYREIWQSFAVLPAVKTVGVQGDDRTYAYPIVLRAVTSDDAMTADWARLPYDVLERISQPDHQRGARGQPGRVRHHVEAAGHDRMGVRSHSMDLNALNAVARAIVAPGKGILAADESSGTIKKRFDTIDTRVDRGSPPCVPRDALHHRRRGGAHQRRDPVRRDDPPERLRRSRARRRSSRSRGSSPASRSTRARCRSRSRPASSSPTGSTACGSGWSSTASSVRSSRSGAP